jgi:hypothetical protein
VRYAIKDYFINLTSMEITSMEITLPNLVFLKNPFIWLPPGVCLEVNLPGTETPSAKRRQLQLSADQPRYPSGEFQSGFLEFSSQPEQIFAGQILQPD